MIRLQKDLLYGLRIPQLLVPTPTGTTHQPTQEPPLSRAVLSRSLSSLASGTMSGVTRTWLMLAAWQQLKLVVEPCQFFSEQLNEGKWFTDFIKNSIICNNSFYFLWKVKQFFCL